MAIGRPTKYSPYMAEVLPDLFAQGQSVVEVCEMLRWKGHDPECEPDEIASVFLKNQVPYTCLCTCQPWGVDDGPATPETCNSKRACFTPRVPAQCDSE